MQEFREAYKQYCAQLDIAPLYELTEDQLVEAAIKQSGHCNLQACRITSSDVIAIAQTIKFHPLIHSIDLRANALDDMAALGLAEAVASTGLPSSIDLRQNALTDVGGQALYDAANNVPSLTALNLESNKLSNELLSSVQALIAARKSKANGTSGASAPAAKPSAPATAAGSKLNIPPAASKRTAPRNNSSYDDFGFGSGGGKKGRGNDSDEEMDLGFDSEIRGRKTPTSPSHSAQLAPHDNNNSSFVHSPPSPHLQPAAATAAGASNARAIEQVPALPGGGARRNSFDQALHEATAAESTHDNHNNVSADGGGFDDFDWNQADTAGLLDGGSTDALVEEVKQAAPAPVVDRMPSLTLEPQTSQQQQQPPAVQRVPSGTTATTAASSSSSTHTNGNSDAAPPQLTKAPSIPTTVAAPTPVEPAAPIVPATPATQPAAAAPAPVAVPVAAPVEAQSRVVDDFDEFNFDDDSHHFDHDPAAHPAPAAVAAAATTVPASRTATFEEEGLLGTEQLSGRQPIVRADDVHKSNFGLTPPVSVPHSPAAANDASSQPHLGRPPSHTSKAAAAASGSDDELARAQAKMRAQIEASHALASEATRISTGAPASAAATTSASGSRTHSRKASAHNSPRAADQSHSRALSLSTNTYSSSSAAFSPSPAHDPTFASPARSQSSGAATGAPFAKPTILPSSPDLWNTDHNDPSATRVAFANVTLGVVSQSLSLFHNLRSLTIRNCGLTSLPPNLPSQLEQLDVSQNSLRSFGPHLNQLRRLVEVNASSNTISSLEGAFSGSPSLRFLHLSGNNLRSISGITQLRGLQLLDLRMNALPHLSAMRELSLNAQLRVLRVAGNPLVLAMTPAAGVSTAGTNQAAALLKSKIQSLLPSLVQLDNQILVLSPKDATGHAAARSGGSLLLDGDLLDILDLSSLIHSLHGPAVRRLFVRLAQSDVSARPQSPNSPPSNAQADQATLPITLILSHLQSLQFVPYFLPELECKVLLSLLAFPNAAGSTGGAPKISVSAFIEFLSRAAWFKQLHLNSNCNSNKEPLPLKQYIKALREANDHANDGAGGMFDQPFLNDLFFSTKQVSSHIHAYVFANYALKSLGLLVAPSSSPVGRRTDSNSSDELNSSFRSNSGGGTTAGYMKQTTTSMRHLAPSPGPGSAVVLSARKSPPPSSSTKGKNVYDRLYTKPPAKPAASPSPSPPPVKQTPSKKKSATPSRNVRRSPAPPQQSLSFEEVDSRATTLNLNATNTAHHVSANHAAPSSSSSSAAATSAAAARKAKAEELARFHRAQEEAALAEARLAEEEYAAEEAAAEAEAQAQAAEMDAAEANQEFSDEHYVPSAAAAASMTAAPNQSSATLSPAQGKLRARPAVGVAKSKSAPTTAASGLGDEAAGEDIADEERSSGSGDEPAGAPGQAMSMDDDSWLDDVDVSTARGIKRIIKNLNEKISKLYNWHLVEIDLVSRQQVQLNSLTAELESTRSNASGMSAAATPTSAHHAHSASAPFFPSGAFDALSPQQNYQQQQQPSPALFSPVSAGPSQFQSQSQPPSVAPQHLPSAAPSPATHDDWQALMHALSVLEATDPNAAEVQILRELLKHEQLGPASTPVHAPQHTPSHSSSFTPASFHAAPPAAVPTTTTFQTPAASPSISAAAATVPTGVNPISVQAILDSYWVSDIREWCRELDEELKTATMALGNILDLTAQAHSREEYDKSIREFESILSISGMLVSFGLPSHVAALLSILPPELLSAIRGSAHRLEATKKSLHSFLALVHAEAPNSPLVQELRQTIVASGVTIQPSSTLDALARNVAYKMAEARQQQQQQQQVIVAAQPNMTQSYAPALSHPAFQQPQQSVQYHTPAPVSSYHPTAAFQPTQQFNTNATVHQTPQQQQHHHHPHQSLPPSRIPALRANRFN